MIGDQIEGIYRIGAGNADVLRITEEFERSQDRAKIDSTQFPDIHTVATYLKKYLRSLPVPVVSFEVYHSLIDLFKYKSSNSKSKVQARIESVRKIVSNLDGYRISNLGAILRHLSNISHQSHANKMTSVNLGAIFGQCLLRDETEDLSQPLKSAHSLTEMPFQNECITFLIEHFEKCFTEVSD